MAVATLTEARKTLTLATFFGKTYKSREYRYAKALFPMFLNQFEGTERLILDQVLYTTEWLIGTGRLDGLVEQTINKTDLKKYFKLVVLPAYKESVKQNWYCSGDMVAYIKSLLIKI